MGRGEEWTLLLGEEKKILGDVVGKEVVLRQKVEVTVTA